MLAGSEKVTTFASAFKKNGCSYKDWKFAIKEFKALCKRDFPKRKVLEKDFWKKICRIKKDDLSLQSFRTAKCETFSNWFFELLVIFWEKRNVVFICQFPFIKDKRIVRTLTKHYLYNGEFDPGSGWTLAAGLTHASRGAAGSSNTPPATGARVRNAYVTYL